MSKAIGMVELKTVSAGITVTDAMVKIAEVDIILSETVCPGKYISIVSGGLGAVNAAVNMAKGICQEQLINSFVLGNPHEDIFLAIYGATQVDNIRALGILETYDVASIIVAADVAAKTAIVSLIEIRIAKGMCGKSYMLLTGEIAAITAAIEKAKAVVKESGMLLDFSVIAHPDSRMIQRLL
jgi:microcompartment protein CcmL/EutN